MVIQIGQHESKNYVQMIEITSNYRAAVRKVWLRQGKWLT